MNTMHYTPEAARLTKKDWDKIAQVLEGEQGDKILEGEEGERKQIDFLFTKGEVRLHWYGEETVYSDETYARFSEWEEFEDKMSISSMDVDEEQILWLMEYEQDPVTGIHEESRNELINIFIEAIG